MSTRRWLVAVGPIALMGMVSCTSTSRAPEPFPNLVADDATPETTAVLKEADHCFVGSVDGHYVPQLQVDILSPGTYRQHMLPPGRHTVAVFYRRQNNFDTVSAGPRFVTLDLEAGKTYALAASRQGIYYSPSDRLPTGYWRPVIVEEGTGKTVGMAPSGDR